jgi:ADP-ribose pyrophosphatase YjhB (NUDIX family)
MSVGPVWPVSVKAVVLWGDEVVLLRNERQEWELPGGRLEPHERPEDCVVREVEEELGIHAIVEQLIDVWVYDVAREGKVLIITYGCSSPRPELLTRSDEHNDVGVFAVRGLDHIRLPAGYAGSIRAWHALQSR